MTNSKHELGRLSQVDLRNVWTSESDEFTPWLASDENLRLLGDTIGIELELEAQEKSVGPFRADILCKDTATEHWVLIENQLERTDHIHLGQLLTYAAGLKAVTIVWLAKRFTEEHRAALDWLNEITDSRFNFFGLEVELWQIGDSLVAPKFNIASKPNDWSKTVAAGASRVMSQTLTDTKLLQRDFWVGFREFAKERDTVIKTTKPLPQHWMNISIGRSGIRLSASAVVGNQDSHELRAGLVMDDQNSKKFYEQLENKRQEIEQELGEELTWHNPEDKRMCRVYLQKPTDLKNREQWSVQHEWLLQKLEKLHNVFSGRVRELVVE